MNDEVEVAGALLVVQGICLFSGVLWGQRCTLFLSIHSHWCSSEIFLTGFLLLRGAKIGPFDPICLTDYARYQWRTPNLSKTICSPLPPHTRRHTHISTFFSSPLCFDALLEDEVSWGEFLENKASLLYMDGPLQVSLDYGTQSSSSSKTRGVSQTSTIFGLMKRLALSHQCYSFQQYFSFSFAMSMETCLGWGGNEERADTHTEKLGSGALMEWYHLQQQPRTPVRLLCTAFMMLASQRMRSLQARYSQTVDTVGKKLQLLVLNTLVDSLWTLLLAYSATFAPEPEESLVNSKPGLFGESFGSFPQVWCICPKHGYACADNTDLFRALSVSLLLLLFSLHPLRASSAPHAHNSHKLFAGAVSSINQFQWRWPSNWQILDASRIARPIQTPSHSGYISGWGGLAYVQAQSLAFCA